MAENFELKLSTEETLALTNKLIGFYEDIVTIQDYFLKRKKEKIEKLNPDDYLGSLFNDFEMSFLHFYFRIFSLREKKSNFDCLKF